MTFQKLSSTDAFVVIDLDGAPATGVVRAAPKILVGGAEDMARSLTYAFAAHGVPRSGASAGINTTPENRDEATAAFAAELLARVGDGTLSIDAAKGIDAAALAELAAADGRSEIRNASDGSVDIIAEGKPSSLDQLVPILHQGPPAASVEAVEVERGPAKGKYRHFDVKW